MELTTLDELLRREPFEPFTLKFSNGEETQVSNPTLVVATKREIFIADAKREAIHIYSLLHVVGSTTASSGSRRE